MIDVPLSNGSLRIGIKINRLLHSSFLYASDFFLLRISEICFRRFRRIPHSIGTERVIWHIECSSVHTRVPMMSAATRPHLAPNQVDKLVGGTVLANTAQDRAPYGCIIAPHPASSA